MMAVDLPSSLVLMFESRTFRCLVVSVEVLAIRTDEFDRSKDWLKLLADLLALW